MRVASSQRALVLKERATTEQVEQIRQLAKPRGRVAVAVDVAREVVAAGFYADAEIALLEDGGRREDIWGGLVAS